MPALEKNHIYRSTIEGYSSEGLGVARIDGQVVFVHDAVRGEDCDILVMKVLKNVAFASRSCAIAPPPTGRSRTVPTMAAAAAATSAIWTTPRSCGPSAAGSGCPDPIGRQRRDRGGNLGCRTAPALPQ